MKEKVLSSQLRNLRTVDTSTLAPGVGFGEPNTPGAKLVDNELLCEDNSSEKCVSSVVYSRKINLEIMEV